MNTIRTLSRRESIRVASTALAALGLMPAVSAISAKMLKLSLLAVVFVALPVQAQTTAFNFQGRLSNLGLPVNGQHDLRFSVYGSQAGADLVSGPITVSPVVVKNGIFNCRLDFGEQVFNGSARWLDISVRPTGTATFTNLSPRVELTSAPYAVRAKEAAVAASVANGSAVKSVNNLKDNVNLAAGANVTLTTNGNTLTIGATGGGGGGGWSTLNNNTYFNSGNVGIGTNAPTSRVDIVGAQDALKITGFQPFMTLRDTNSGNARGIIQSVGGGLNFFSEQYLNGSIPAGFMRLHETGNVGLGTAVPTSKLDIFGAQDAVKITGYQPLMTLRDTSSGNARGVIQSVAGGLNLFSEDYLNGSSPAGFLRLNGDGNVGVGAAVPVSKLDVRGALTLESGGNATLYTGTAGAEQNRYLNLINSPSAPSASGLKAGGVLVSDDYGYANPSKNELVVKGKITTGGDAVQSRDKGGFVKAMLRVRYDGVILNCYNSLPVNASLPNGGITVNHFAQGGYGIDFGFPVRDRFILVTVEQGRYDWDVGSPFPGPILVENWSAYYRFASSPTTVDVRTFKSGEVESTFDQSFTIFIF